MDLKSTKKELEAAYEKLDKTEKRVSSILKELNETEKAIDVLVAAGFLTEEKIQQARDIVMNFS